jgi:radical SAM superfamily enzyme YgiQ (UPF0313 family)
MKILFIQPPHHFDGKSRRPGFFPIGLGYLTAVLQGEGHEVEVFDIWAEQVGQEEVLKRIPKLSYDVAGITALSTQYNYVKWLAEQLKRDSDKPLVLGGPLATFSADLVLEKTPIDFCVLSEGDVSFPNLLRNLGEPDKVRGIVFRRNGQIVATPDEEYVNDLDSLGFPLRDPSIFKTDVYLTEGYLDGHPEVKALNITTNRGCPYRCDFCSKTYTGVRSRSEVHVRQEIEKLKEDFGIGAVFFNDELLVLNKKRIYALCEEIKPLKMLWQGQARVNTVDEDVLKCMKDAGCVSVGLGIESGSQRILDAMNKRTKVAQNVAAIEAAKKVGLDVIVQCIYGYPGESDETIAETIDFFRQADHLDQGFFVLTPLPGTAIYGRCLEQGFIKDEDAYLSNLDAGYNTDRSALVNLTQFGLDEFYDKKRFLERKILTNYFLRHPFKRIVARDKNNNLRPILLARKVLSTLIENRKGQAA